LLGYHKKAPANAGSLFLFESSHLRTSSGGWIQIKKNLPPGGFFFVIPAGFKPFLFISPYFNQLPVHPIYTIFTERNKIHLKETK